MPASAPLADELLSTLSDEDIELVPTLVDDLVSALHIDVADLQGLRGPQGEPGPPGPQGEPGAGVDPDAIPRAPPRAIAAGATLPVPPLGVGSFVYSTLALTILVFDGERWKALGSGTIEPEPPDETVLVNALGQTLVNDMGEVLHNG